MELQVPLYYVVSRASDPDSVRNLLGTTPPICTIISNAQDARLALGITDEVLRVNSPKDALDLAHTLAIDTQRAVAVIGEADSVSAVYADGGIESLC